MLSPRSSKQNKTKKAQGFYYYNQHFIGDLSQHGKKATRKKKRLEKKKYNSLFVDKCFCDVEILQLQQRVWKQAQYTEEDTWTVFAYYRYNQKIKS